MNADSFPLGYAPFVLYCTRPNGDVDILGRFVRKYFAESEMQFLAGICPENKYHIGEDTPVFPSMEGKI